MEEAPTLGASLHQKQPISYFTGAPLVRVEFSYNETMMFPNVGGEVASAEITEEQLSALNGLHPNEQMHAASIFGKGYGPERH